MFVKEGCFKTSSNITFFVSGKSKMSARLPRANARSRSTSKILERDLNRLYCAREPASFSRILLRHFQLEAKVPRLLKFGRSTLEPIIIIFSRSPSIDIILYATSSPAKHQGIVLPPLCILLLCVVVVVTKSPSHLLFVHIIKDLSSA